MTNQRTVTPEEAQAAFRRRLGRFLNIEAIDFLTTPAADGLNFFSVISVTKLEARAAIISERFQKLTVEEVQTQICGYDKEVPPEIRCPRCLPDDPLTLRYWYAINEKGLVELDHKNRRIVRGNFVVRQERNGRPLIVCGCNMPETKMENSDHLSYLRWLSAIKKGKPIFRSQQAGGPWPNYSWAMAQLVKEDLEKKLAKEAEEAKASQERQAAEAQRLVEEELARQALLAQKVEQRERSAWVNMVKLFGSEEDQIALAEAEVSLTTTPS